MPSNKAFWTEYFNDAYQDAAQKRREVIDRGLLLIAHLIREELPTATATAITVEHGNGQLAAVHDTKGDIWRPGDKATRGKLRRSTLNEVMDTLLDVLSLARTVHPLLAADWKPVRDVGDTYRAELPADPDKEQDAAPAADDRPHGAPGEGAGKCAQCGRLLVWDGSGKRVNDEWGEYLCYGPRPGDVESALHVLAAPEPAEA
ncbi:hypothetical protein [Streptomyces sp. NBC_00519]|uniref:hypothetical protein n=1 Tax=Streptomyces sp. NBC_00519 TaxID=2975764 RepID=UPI0030E04706